MKTINTKKKLTMTKEEAEKELANFDWAGIAEECNANVVVAVGTKRFFWHMELLIACKKEKGIIPTTDLLIAHCRQEGIDYPEAKLRNCSICLVARSVSLQDAIKESLSDD